MTEPHPQDFEDPEDFADAVGTDPTPQQVDEYREETEHPRRPDADHEPKDTTGGSGA